MKLTLLFLALLLASGARAEIGLSDMDSVNPPAPQRHPPANEPAPAKPAHPAVPAPAPPRIGPKDGLVRFRNGDTLHGLLQTIDNTAGMDWRYPDSKEDLHFSLQNVMEIALAGAGPAPTGNAIVSLTNGDVFRGDIISLDDQTLTLSTAYAGPLKIKRVMVASISPRRGMENVLLDGLISLDGWKRFNGAEHWQLHEGVLTIPQAGTIGRDFPLPDRCAVEFDMAWQPIPYLQIGLYASQPDFNPGNSGGSAYWIDLMPNMVLFQRQRPNDSAQLGQVEVHRFSRPGSVRVGIYADKLKKTFSVTLDGQLLRTWTDTDDFAGSGTSLILMVPPTGNHSFQISNLLVRQWTGELDDSPAVPSKTDILTLANNDRVSGLVKSIRQGTVVVTSSVAPLEIPVERVSQIYLSNENAERARRLAADVVAVFHDGGKLTLALDQLDGKTLSGHSENFGKATFNRDAFRELEFHIYDEDRGLSAESEISLSSPGMNEGQIFNGNGNGIRILNGGQMIIQGGGQLFIGQ
jgi:hypothetical protein